MRNCGFAIKYGTNKLLRSCGEFNEFFFNLDKSAIYLY